jgi:hypothetical protein
MLPVSETILASFPKQAEREISFLAVPGSWIWLSDRAFCRIRLAEHTTTLTLTAYGDAPPRGRVTTAKLEKPATSRLPLLARLYLVMTVLPILFNVGSLAMSGQRMLLLLIVVPLTLKLLRGACGRIIWTDYFFFLHMAWATVAIAVNNPDRVLQNVGSIGVEFLGGYLVGRAYIRSVGDFLALIRFLGILVCTTFPFAVFETLTGRPILIELIRKIPGFTSVAILNIEARMGLERSQVLFAHPIHYGLFCSAAFSLVFVGLKGLVSTTRRYLTAIIIAICVFFSLSSGALLPILLQIFLILWVYALRDVRQRWIILLGIFIVIYVLIDLLSNRAPIGVFMSYATFSAHNAYWRGIIFDWGMMNVWANPIFGLGLNEWVRPFFMRKGSVDNFWLLNAMQYGIPGFLLLVIGYLPALWWIGRRDFDADLRLWQLRRAWMFTFMGLTLTLCTVHVWTSIFSFVFFLFGAGMWFLTAEPVSTDQQGRAGPTASRPKTTYSRSFSDPKSMSLHMNRGQKTPSPAQARTAASLSKPRRNEGLYTRSPPSGDA